MTFISSNQILIRGFDKFMSICRQKFQYIKGTYSPHYDFVYDIHHVVITYKPVFEHIMINSLKSFFNLTLTFISFTFNKINQLIKFCLII